MRTTITLFSLAGLLTTFAAAADDNDSEIETTALIQSWITLYDADVNAQADPGGYGDPEHDMGLSIQRARFGIKDSTGPIRYAVEVGTSAPYDVWFDGSGHQSLGLSDAFLQSVGQGENHQTSLSMGAMKTPFGREGLISASDLSFQERAVGTTHISPGRDLGLLADYKHKSGLRFRLGTFNGGGDLSGDDNNGLLHTLRVEYGKGKSYQVVSTTGKGAWGIGLSGLYEDDQATAIVGSGADFLLRTARFGFLVDVAMMTLTPDEVNVSIPEVYAPTTRIGATVQASYLIPTQDGGLEIATRYGSYDDAKDLVNNGDVSIIHTGLVLHNDASKIDMGLGYILRLETGGQAYSNDTARVWAQFAL